MTTWGFVQRARADGVSLSLSPSGSIKARGDGEAVKKWLPVLRERKEEIVAEIRSEATTELDVLPPVDIATATTAIPATESGAGIAKIARIAVANPRGFILDPGGEQAQAFDEAFDRVSREVQARYVRGTCYLVHDHHPDLFKATEVARKRMVKLWEVGRSGGGDLEAFKVALAEWARLRGLWAAAIAKGQEVGTCAK